MKSLQQQSGGRRCTLIVMAWVVIGLGDRVRVAAQDWNPEIPSLASSDAGDFPDSSLRRPAVNFFTVARESIFGAVDDRPWRPLPLRTLLTEGWLEPWSRPPNGTSGGTRQGWIGAVDGNFYRLFYFTFAENFHVPQGSNGYASHFNLYTPLSRRLLLLTTIPYLNANSPSFNLGNTDFGNSGASTNTVHGKQTSFGDFTLTPRVMLAESRNLSVAAQVAFQAPTGNTNSGAGRAIISPGIHFWSDIGRAWALRGGFNVSEGVNKAGIGTTLTSQLAIGQTVTPHDVPILGDFTYYLTMNASSKVAPTASTTVTLGPGYRTHLGNNCYSLGAVSVPVTGPHPYDESLTLWLLKIF